MHASWICNYCEGVEGFRKCMGIDVTEQTNNEKRPLLVLGGLTGDNKTFTSCRAFLPSQQRWVFDWFLSTALPYLFPMDILGNGDDFNDDDDGNGDDFNDDDDGNDDEDNCNGAEYCFDENNRHDGINATTKNTETITLKEHIHLRNSFADNYSKSWYVSVQPIVQDLGKVAEANKTLRENLNKSMAEYHEFVCTKKSAVRMAAKGPRLATRLRRSDIPHKSRKKKSRY
jgi:hypothetical protein